MLGWLTGNLQRSLVRLRSTLWRNDSFRNNNVRLILKKTRFHAITHDVVFFLLLRSSRDTRVNGILGEMRILCVGVITCVACGLEFHEFVRAYAIMFPPL